MKRTWVLLQLLKWQTYDSPNFVKVSKIVQWLTDFPRFASASGYEITGPVTYFLGQQMYFEAKTAQSGDKRMYVNKCYMTGSQGSNQLYTVIDNQG